MGRVDNFPNLWTLWPTLRNVTKVNARLMRGQLWKFLICNIHSLKTSSKDALAPAEPRLIGRPGLMALPLTMTNNCLSLLNWLMKSAEVKTAVFFLPKWHFLWSLMEKWMKMWILNYTKRGLWLLMMACVKRLHYFNTYSTMGLIAGKIRARWGLQSTFFFLDHHSDTKSWRPSTKTFSCSLEGGGLFLLTLRGFIQPWSCWGLRCTT